MNLFQSIQAVWRFYELKPLCGSFGEITFGLVEVVLIMQIKQVLEDACSRVTVGILIDPVFVVTQALICRTAMSAASRVGSL